MSSEYDAAEKIGGAIDEQRAGLRGEVLHAPPADVFITDLPAVAGHAIGELRGVNVGSDLLDEPETATVRLELCVTRDWLDAAWGRLATDQKARALALVLAE